MLDQDIAILGFGVTGQSVARFLLAQGIAPRVFDTRENLVLPEEFVDLDITWRAKPQDMASCATAYVSPGLSLASCELEAARAAGVRLRSDIDLFFDHVPAPVLGITGTNGKSTVTTMVEHVLRASHVAAAAGGNLGLPALDLLDDEVQCYVLELSSFQLQRSEILPLRAATVLNISADHIDMHGDYANYVASKRRIYDAAAYKVWNRDDSATKPDPTGTNDVSFGLSCPTAEHEYGIGVCDGERMLMRGTETLAVIDELPLAGSHNELNALASFAMVDGLGAVTDLGSLASFAGLAHRFEFVADIDGVRYINDSKATNVGSTIAALDGLPEGQTTILIAGGDAKGADLGPLAPRLHTRVRCVLSLGVDAHAIEAQAEVAGVQSQRCDSLDDAVARAARIAAPGDTVLLSPACASLDMFDNYARRGEAFCAAVAELSQA